MSLKRFFRKTTFMRWGAILVGAALYALTFNWLIVPLNLYSGNLTGVAQVVSDLLNIFILHGDTNYTGTILWMFNIPLFILAFFKLGKNFTIKSIIIATFLSAVMQFAPIPSAPIIEDPLTACILGGIIAGFGSGLILRNGGSAGGTDILGMYFAKKYPDFSVGKIQNIISAGVYCYCLFRYDIEAVVYSAIYLFVMSFVIDKTHTQNIKSSAIIFTKHPEIEDCILKDLKRGATRWIGAGCYNKTETYIYMTIISKYEVAKLRKLIHEVDPDAFIIMNNDIDVDGNFIKRL
ncbi:MAG: YitT family protein [Agathobacter sp.]